MIESPFLLRNYLLPLIIFTHKSLLNLTHHFKLLEFIRHTLITTFLFFLNIIPSFLPFYNSDSDSDSDWVPFLKHGVKCNDISDTCIARALSQLLSILNEIPVSSRKYEIVRSYAEKLMDENLVEGYEPLRKVNATVLGSAFSRALRHLEMAATDDCNNDCEVKKRFELNRKIKAVWTRFMKKKNRVAGSAEKLSAELLWLAEKLAASGSGDEAVWQWASASKLAYVALSAQPRLQGSLVKLSAFLFKQAASMGAEDEEEGNLEELRKIKFKMLMSWVPFLCRASIGTDAPVLSFNEKVELENVLGELIASLNHEEEQEKVLSLWLHHFTYCPSSDWPNLHLYYARWCTTSRKLLILERK